MAKHITHGKNTKSKPNKSKTQANQQQDAQQQEPQNSFMVPPQTPDLNAPGMDLGFDAPGAGFAPH